MDEDKIDVEYLGVSKISKDNVISFNFKTKDKVKQRVTKITGVCSKYGFKREFLEPIYKNVNASQSGHAMYLRAFRWDLEAGFIYEYKNLMVCYLSKVYESGYFIALVDGIVPIEMEQVRVYLNMRIKKGKIVEMPTFNSHDGDYAEDDVPF